MLPAAQELLQRYMPFAEHTGRGHQDQARRHPQNRVGMEGCLARISARALQRGSCC
jgi:hypothetical protein